MSDTEIKSPARVEDGEEGEVVGWRISSESFGSYLADSELHACPDDTRESLMTVAQHQRIVADLKANLAMAMDAAAKGDVARQQCGGMEMEIAELRAALSAPPAAGVSEEWQPMETAPTDGTLLRLLVEFEDHPIEDGAGPFATVGTNYRDNTGEDAWQIVGWCWEQDRFIDGVGTPVGWLPMLAAPTPPQENDR